MKKLLLSFMSLFLVLGTAMAQDDKKEEDETPTFGLSFSNPSENIPASNVEYIQLQFTKDVTISLPTEDIIIKGSNTGEEFKVVNPQAFGPNAILYVEQVTGSTSNEEAEKAQDDGKDDGKDDSNQGPAKTITTPDTYTYTIPAGFIKSIDDEVFEGGTFTFTVIEALNHEFITPATVEKLEKVEIKFSDAIKTVDISKVNFLDPEYKPIEFKDSIGFSEDKKTVTLELKNSTSTPGYYIFNAGPDAFTSEKGAKNEYIYYEINIVDANPTPEFITNYKDGDQVEKINDLEITFKNVTEVKLAEGEDAPKAVIYYHTAESDFEGQATKDDENNNITVTFGQEFTAPGEYQIVIPEGLFTMDGVANEYRAITITIKEAFKVEPLEIIGIYPEAGAVEQIEDIYIKFNQPVQLYYTIDGATPSMQIKLTCGEKEYILNNDYNNDPTILVYTTKEWGGNDWISNPITEPGTYTLSMEQIIVNYGAEDIIDQYGYPAKKYHKQNEKCPGTYTWTIAEADNAIDIIDAEAGEQAIYDLLGRRIEKITGTGIYIVNGKKVVIK